MRVKLQDVRQDAGQQVQDRQLLQALQLLQPQGRRNGVNWVLSPDGLRLTAVGAIARTESQPMMKGDLKTVVNEIGKALRRVQGDDPVQGIAALGVVQRATMKARRLLRTMQELTEIPTEEEIRTLTQVQFFRAALQQPGTTRLGNARSALSKAVASVRQATNVKEASKGFDEVEKTTAALRSLLWELKPKKS